LNESPELVLGFWPFFPTVCAFLSTEMFGGAEKSLASGSSRGLAERAPGKSVFSFSGESCMDLNKVLAELIKERDLLDEAIAHLERFSTGAEAVSIRPQRRGYPDKRQEKARDVSTPVD
jgi:hypothetical protein